MHEGSIRLNIPVMNIAKSERKCIHLIGSHYSHYFIAVKWFEVFDSESPSLAFGQRLEAKEVAVAAS